MAAMTTVALLAAACGGAGQTAALPASVQNGQLTVDGVERTYRVFIPPTLDRSVAAPLVLVLHGGANTVADTIKITGFDKQASIGDFIVAYPVGTRQEWNAGGCCGSAPERNVDDVGFLTRLLDQLSTDYRIDQARVFVTGVSNGAMMAYRFACERADRVTAVASVAGAVVVDECQPSRPMSVLEIHGTEDPLVPYEGGTPSAPEAAGAPPQRSTTAMMQRWAALGGCPPPTPPNVVGAVTVESWTGCAGGRAVELVTVRGGGHIWFAPGLGPANGAVDATETIWGFFRDLK
jgi:polyhydroxybutyrate depolymerase